MRYHYNKISKFIIRKNKQNSKSFRIHLLVQKNVSQRQKVKENNKFTRKKGQFLKEKRNNPKNKREIF